MWSRFGLGAILKARCKMQSCFLVYRRPDGRVGIRNWIAIVAVMENCNSVVRGIVRSVYGTVAIPTTYVRGQLGRDLEITLSALAGLAKNPNIAGVVVVGLEPVTTEGLASRTRQFKPV